MYFLHHLGSSTPKWSFFFAFPVFASTPANGLSSHRAEGETTWAHPSFPQCYLPPRPPRRPILLSATKELGAWKVTLSRRRLERCHSSCQFRWLRCWQRFGHASVLNGRRAVVDRREEHTRCLVAPPHPGVRYCSRSTRWLTQCHQKEHGTGYLRHRFIAIQWSRWPLSSPCPQRSDKAFLKVTSIAPMTQNSPPTRGL